MSRGRITSIAGPVLTAVTDEPFALHEAVRIGPQALLGEVMRIDGPRIVAQVYEDTTGLRPGIEVEGDGTPLAIRLGPALLGRMFDGLLRPLADAGTSHLRAGVRVADPSSFDFAPSVRAGDALPPGSIIGIASRDGTRDQRCLAPPAIGGEVIDAVTAGRYRDDETVVRVRDRHGAVHALSMSHTWPVRMPRPAAARRTASVPLVTGQRILDALFPLALGGKAAVPGGFGTGKTVLLEALAKGCSADVIVYLGCGERGNEIAGVLDEFPRLDDPKTGRPLMERTVIIANTSNMAVAAREASIYCAMTVAEYFRDQGLAVALMADSTSRWAEALREVSGRFGELPGEGGYPAYLSSRLADFYERAAVVDTLAGNEGSVTVIGAISPPSGDFSEPVTSHTKRYVKGFWALDARRAQARFYPAIHPLTSYAEDANDFAAWWASNANPDWLALRRRFLTLLDDEARIERMARIIGKDALPPKQQLTLLCAELVNEAFLRQSALSMVDRVCAPAKTAAMMKLVGKFCDLAERALARGVQPQALVRLPARRALIRMGEDVTAEESARFDEIALAMERDFAALATMGESDAADR
jgi:V/A-type H+-transporting ATPase subunit A